MKILVTGGTGMVGSAFKKLDEFHNHDLIMIGSKDYDLRDPHDAWSAIGYAKPDAIIHLAAKVGGVKGNSENMSDFYCENIQINTNVLWAACNQRVGKVLSLLSTCVYPDNPLYPLTEDQIHSGPPHISNFGYAYAKRMLDVHSRSIRQQFGLKYITAIPNNIYGANDNFDLENGHVIPAIIRKIYEAKKSKIPPEFWGSGAPLREFTYSNDIAKAILLLLEIYEGESPVNIGKTGDISIKDVVRIISNSLDYDGDVLWDTTKPEGQYKKPSSNKNFLNMFDEFKYTSFEQGIKETCEWFIKNYPNVRGI